jgi:hypothetical protein
MISVSKDSSPRPGRKNRKAQPRCSTKRSHARHKMKYWEIIADNLSKAGLEFGLGFSPWILSGERSGLLTRIAATTVTHASGRSPKIFGTPR